MGDSDEPKRSGRQRPRRRISWWQETALLLGLALLLSVLVKAFVAQMFYVPSGSMRPQFAVDDRIVVEKISSWSGEVDRGDVVVFRDPGGWLGVAPEPQGLQRLLSAVGLYPSGGHLVKRVVGVGGDRVTCCDDRGRLSVNGVALDESEYLRPGADPSREEFEVTVPEDSVWVMGDNRSNSQDSRAHQDVNGGAVPLEAVVGEVWAILWPPDRAEVLDDPEVFDDPALDAQPD